MGFSLDWLLSSLVVGSAGFGFLMYGKKQSRLPQLLAGVALVVDSFVVASCGWMLAGAAAVLAALCGVLRAGM